MGIVWIVWRNYYISHDHDRVITFLRKTKCLTALKTFIWAECMSKMEKLKVNKSKCHVKHGLRLRIEVVYSIVT